MAKKSAVNAETESEQREIEPTTYIYRWLLSETEVAKFDPADVCRLASISSHTLQNWANRKLITPTASAKGKGSTRRYDKMQVLWIKLARGISSLGIEAGASLHIASNIIVKLANRIAESPESPIVDRILVKIGAAVFVDHLGRVDVDLAIPNEKSQIYAEEHQALGHSEDVIFISLGKKIWDLYKAECALSIENDRGA